MGPDSAWRRRESHSVYEHHHTAHTRTTSNNNVQQPLPCGVKAGGTILSHLLSPQPTVSASFPHPQLLSRLHSLCRNLRTRTHCICPGICLCMYVSNHWCHGTRRKRATVLLALSRRPPSDCRPSFVPSSCR